jgi:Tfp pilus assembly protein PilV
MSSDARGTSVVEVIVALVVLHVGIVAVLSTATLTVRWTHEASVDRRATRSMRQVLDSLAAFGFTASGRDSSAQGRVEWRGSAAGGLANVTIDFFPPDSATAPMRTLGAVVRSGS